MTAKYALPRVIFTVLLLAGGALSFGPAAGRFGAYRSDNEKGLQRELTEKSAQVLAVWGAARGISGLVSLLESLEAGVSLGFSGSVRPFGWLSPAEDLLDKLSDICLYAMGALIIEKLLLAMSGWAAFRIIIPVCAALCVLSLWAGRRKGGLLKVIAVFALTGAALCGAVPLSIWLSRTVEARIFTKEIDKTIADINAGGEAVTEMQGAIDKQGFSSKVIDSVRGFFTKAKDLSYSLASSVMNYIMIFAVTNVILPLLTILGLGFLVKYLASLLQYKERASAP